MKKLLFLFLLTFTTISYSQTTLANKLKITANITDNTASKVNVQDATGLINTIPKLDLIDVFEYASAINLPITGVSSKIYVTIDNKKLYRWNGTIYQELASTNILGKENIANKQNDLTPDGTGTKYPTVDAVNAEMVKLSGNQTISGTKTYSDKITIKGNNVASSNIQTGSMYMSDTGSVRSNFTIDADATSPEGANIRLQVSSPNSHIGINKAGTLNSALALLWDNTNTGASIDLRGNAFLTNSATMQFTRLSQLNNDFIIKNFVAGNTILDNTKVGINTDNPLSALQVNTSGQGFIRIGGSDGRTIESFTNVGVSSNTNVTNLSTTTIYSTNIIDRTSNQLAINFGANFIAFKTANTEKVRLAVSGALLLNKTTDDGIATNKLQVNGNVKATQFRISALNTAPASATDTGTLGEVRITATYIYVCTATNTWVRTALTTW